MRNELTEDQISAALTSRERRRVRRAVQGGDPVWDEASARYAVAVEAQLRRALVLGRRPHYVLNVAITALFVVGAVDAAKRGAGLELGLFTGFALIFGFVSVAMPWAMRNAARTRQINARFLDDDFAIARPAHAGRSRYLGPIGNGVASGLAFGGLQLLFSDVSLAGASVAGVLFGVFTTAIDEFARARERRRGRTAA